MPTVTFQGKPVELGGQEINLGDRAPQVRLVAQDLSEIEIASGKHVQIIVAVPSLDTPVCATEARKFNERTASLPNTEVIVVSMDLPFAMGRFCTTEGIKNLRVASDFRDKEFCRRYGTLIASGALAGLSARAIFVIDTAGVVVYKELVSDIASEPDYDAALDFAELVARNSCSN